MEHEFTTFDEFLPPKSAEALRSLLNTMAAKEEEEAEILERCKSGATSEHLSTKKKIKSSSTVREIISALHTTNEEFKIQEENDEEQEEKVEKEEREGEKELLGQDDKSSFKRPETAVTVEVEQNDDGDSLSSDTETEVEEEVVKPPRTYNNNNFGRRISREHVLTYVQNKQSGFNQNKNKQPADDKSEDGKEKQKKFKPPDVIEAVPEEPEIDDVFDDDVNREVEMIENEFEAGESDEEEELDPEYVQVSKTL